LQCHAAMTVVRTKPGTQRAYAFASDNQCHHIKQAPMINDQGFLYTVYYSGLPNGDSLIIDNFSGEFGSSYLMKFPSFGNLANLQVKTWHPDDPLLAAASMSDLENASTDAYYVDAGDLYFKGTTVKSVGVDKKA